MKKMWVALHPSFPDLLSILRLPEQFLYHHDY